MPNTKLAYVLGRGNSVVGMAFVVSPCQLITCAHVVAAALAPDCDKFDPVKPKLPIKLHFFETEDALATAQATVVDWRRCVRPDDPNATPIERENADMALLELDSADAKQLAGPRFAVRMCPIKLLNDLRPGREFTVFGSPNGGVLGRASIGGSRGARWIVLRENGAHIEAGFSGAAAIADEKDGTSQVLGMIVRAHDREDQALLIPALTLAPLLIANGIAATPLPAEPVRGHLPVSLRLEIEDLYVLKDRTDALDAIRDVLQNRTRIGPLPTFLVDCNPLTDTLDGLIKRLGFEVARDFGLTSRLEILDFDVPDDVGDLDQISSRHARDVAASLQLGSAKDALARAALCYHGVHLRDVELRSARGIELVVRLVADWAKASSGRTKEVPFFALLTTTGPHDPPERLKLAAALASYPQVEFQELQRLGPVYSKQLRRWARDANAHLPRPVRETAAIESAAQELIYGEKEEMCMMDWYEGFAEHQSDIFRGV